MDEFREERVEYEEWMISQHNKNVKCDVSVLSSYQLRLLRMIRKHGYMLTEHLDSNRWNNPVRYAIVEYLGDENGYEEFRTIQRLEFYTAEALQPFLYMHILRTGESKGNNIWRYELYKVDPPESENDGC